MRATLAFMVDGDPVPQPRPRVVRTPAGKSRTFESDSATRWKKHVRIVAQRAIQVVKLGGRRWERTGDFAVTIVVRRARAAGDVDNFAKGVMDAINGIAWDDDRQVRELLIQIQDRAEYAEHGNGPGVAVTVRRDCG